MANRVNRYQALYEAMPRGNNSAPFPRHVFVRAANLHSNIHDRVGDRENCFKSTLVHLTERFKGKEVYLVGTCNQSTMLAQRTKKLIEELKPDTVIVQTSEKWWNSARQLKFVDSQEEMSKYGSQLDSYLSKPDFSMYSSQRKWLFQARLWLYALVFKWHFRLGFDFQFYRPGLETKFACEAAEKVGAKLEFAGSELDGNSLGRLAHETRLNLPEYLVKRYQYNSSQWTDELISNRIKVGLVGPAAFTEKCLDQHLMNWYIQSASAFFPQFKRIFVDEKDEDLFEQIDKHSGEKIVVLVNQWHLEGIEHHWCNRYGQLPRSVEFPEGIDPIGDMNLREGLFQRLYNNLGREVASAKQKSYPATYADWIIGYHREANLQYEHRDM